MTAAPLLKRALVYGGLLAAAVAVLGSAIGFVVDGVPGLLGALVGAGMTAVFLGLTAATILLATRVSKGELFSTAFFGIVMGGWLVKLLVFFAIVVLLAQQDFLNPMVLFVTIVVAVLGSLAADVLAFTRTRTPIDVKLPGDDRAPEAH
jgi:hypothetical protein